MDQLGVESKNVFLQWLHEEHNHLIILQAKLKEEMVQMEYYKKLVALYLAEVKLEAAHKVWTINTPESLAGLIHD
ncbi:uncharacterized protein ARMOST_16191 [Armillaria ostoyae]|uniref:Uncharacterized protein n=1 Tax=Armillaria ostoyae TaxID=47428 RepID=A0A284RVH5_ARMOS|nr:uncharacterized protein ARMOST_16191 [Armillaria ostoyae]